MTNLRPMALPAGRSKVVAQQVEHVLDHIAEAADDEDPRSVRLEVANAARRWSARVDEEEFPSSFDNEPTTEHEPSLALPPEPEPYKLCDRCQIGFLALVEQEGGGQLCVYCHSEVHSCRPPG